MLMLKTKFKRTTSNTISAIILFILILAILVTLVGKNVFNFFVQLFLVVSIYKRNYVIVYLYFLVSFILIAHCSFYGPFIVALYILITQDLMHLFDGSNINMGFNRLQKYYMHTR